MKKWIADHRLYFLVAMLVTLFSLWVHLGGAYLVYRRLGAGFIFKVIVDSLIIIDLPVRAIYSLTGRGLLFEFLELSAAQRLIDLWILFLVNYAGWIGLLFGLRFLGRTIVPGSWRKHQ